MCGCGTAPVTAIQYMLRATFKQHLILCDDAVKAVNDFLPIAFYCPSLYLSIWRVMAQNVGTVLQQDMPGKGNHAENKDHCVTCQKHTPKGHGECGGGLHILRCRWIIIRVPGLHVGCAEERTLGVSSFTLCRFNVVVSSDSIWSVCSGSVTRVLDAFPIFCRKDEVGEGCMSRAETSKILTTFRKWINSRLSKSHTLWPRGSWWLKQCSGVQEW